MYRSILIALCVLSLTCCARIPIPQTPAAINSGYTYIPIDPFPVNIVLDPYSCAPFLGENEDGLFIKESFDENKFRPLLESLPDNAVRMSIEQFSGSGNVKYGPAGIGLKGNSYKVTVDYVNSATTNFRVLIARAAFNKYTGENQNINLLTPLDDRVFVNEYYDVDIFPPYQPLPPTNIKKEGEQEEQKKTPFALQYYEYNIPIYVGIGLRVTADVDVIGASANISGLGIIGAEAEANSLKGSLIVQTLGVNGKSIAAALPIQSELNRTTAQNAIVAVGSIKTLLYDKETIIVPRVVGLYLPFPADKLLVNRIISVISKSDALEWQRYCGRQIEGASQD